MAIAFDLATNSTILTSVTSLTFSHTCTGANRILFVAIGAPVGDVVSGVTYAGVSMTLVNKAVENTRYVYMYYLIAPATSANNVVVSCGSTADSLGATAVSYTGTKQTGQPDNSTIAGGISTSRTTTLTTVANNCWAIICGRCDNAVTAGTNVTKRGDAGDSTFYIVGDSNGAISPAGSYGQTITWAGSADNAYVMASFSPYTNIDASETISATDTAALVKGVFLSASDTFAVTDTARFKYAWGNPDKSSTTWVNPDKS
jgi:hypothetical protein